MQVFSYVITDLADKKSKPIEAALENFDEALRYGNVLARHMLEATPDLIGKGICVTVLNSVGQIVSVLPFDCLNGSARESFFVTKLFCRALSLRHSARG